MMISQDLPESVIAQIIAGRLVTSSPGHNPGDFGKRLRTNGDVQRAFANQKPGWVGNRPGREGHVNVALASDGVSLWSYGWWEMARWLDTPVGPVCIRRVGKSFGITTAKQMSGIEARPSYPASEETSKYSATMQL